MHDCAVKIMGLKLPFAALVYEGYVPYSLYPVAKGKAYAVMRKALDVLGGVYYVEFPLDGFSLLTPLKYNKYVRKGRRAGGDSDAFYVPQDVALFLRQRGVFELGVEAGYVYVKIWANMLQIANKDCVLYLSNTRLGCSPEEKEIFSGWSARLQAPPRQLVNT